MYCTTVALQHVQCDSSLAESDDERYSGCLAGLDDQWRRSTARALEGESMYSAFTIKSSSGHIVAVVAYTRLSRHVHILVAVHQPLPACCFVNDETKLQHKEGSCRIQSEVSQLADFPCGITQTSGTVLRQERRRSKVEAFPHESGPRVNAVD